MSVPVDPIADMDGTPARKETDGLTDTDMDGTPARKETDGLTDTDMDGTPARKETDGLTDTDMDGTPARKETDGLTDTDMDGTPARKETDGLTDTDMDGNACPERNRRLEFDADSRHSGLHKYGRRYDDVEFRFARREKNFYFVVITKTDDAVLAITGVSGTAAALTDLVGDGLAFGDGQCASRIPTTAAATASDCVSEIGAATAVTVAGKLAD